MIIQLIGTVILPGLGIILIILLGKSYTANIYRCDNCGARIKIDFFTGLTVPHRMGKKFVCCPKCGRRTWVTPIGKDE